MHIFQERCTCVSAAIIIIGPGCMHAGKCCSNFSRKEGVYAIETIATYSALNWHTVQLSSRNCLPKVLPNILFMLLFEQQHVPTCTVDAGSVVDP